MANARTEAARAAFTSLMLWIILSPAVGHAQQCRGSVTSVTLRNGTIATLNVGPPWWSWSWLGLIDQPNQGTVAVFKNVQQQYNPWWCLWLCTETETVQQPVNASVITVAALGLATVGGDHVQSMGQNSCRSCSSVTLWVQNIGVPAPAWAGGGTLKGIGYSGTVEGAPALHAHWGSNKTTQGATAFPCNFD